MLLQENFSSCLDLSYLPSNKEGVNIDIPGEFTSGICYNQAGYENVNYKLPLYSLFTCYQIFIKVI